MAGQGGENARALTTEVEQVGVEEGLPVELLDVQDGGTLQPATQGLLGAALVRDERLQHGPDHVQLLGGGAERGGEGRRGEKKQGEEREGEERKKRKKAMIHNNSSSKRPLILF